jgi:hypothetical protein
LTTAKGVTIFWRSVDYKERKIIKAEMGSVLLGTSSLDRGRNRASDIIWEVRRPERIG